ncbi:capsid assembly scaffolding protein Gp46 family protein [Clostridium scatologenes]|uniref:DUF4355 domain-containing protein n=1 Tax=Clostridium scatologenes TaxID=1548 RepID=A0A0E3K2X8_CLOSL|nr:DUF4355 domain-containing protein [Clostridium scatologenes]AKA71227.1 hypothetical protein CSCA_4102 [Clostridium scatologenes]
MEEVKTTETNTEVEGVATGDTNRTEVKTYTEEEVNKLLNAKIQSETDKVRTEYSKKMKTLEEEVKTLKPVEKSESELKLEERLKALEDKEKEVQAKEKLLNITNKLSEQGLPSQLAKYLMQGEDVETEIASLKEIFTNNVIDNSYKPQNHKSSKDVITKEQFNKMSYMDRMNLFKSNKDLYQKLSK